MTLEVVGTCLLIILARIGDVSLGTVRTVAVIHGRRATAWWLGFFEVLLWVVVVSAVIQTVRENLWYAVAYAFGFATGNYIGIAIEQYFAYGHQVIRIFTRCGEEMARHLREQGLGVTMFQGEGRDGPVQMLFIETARKGAVAVTRLARTIDSRCYYVVDDIRAASEGRKALGVPSEAAGVEKRK